MSDVMATVLSTNTVIGNAVEVILDTPEIEITEYHDGLNITQDRSEKSCSSVWRHFGSVQKGTLADNRHVYCIHCFKLKKIKKYQKSTSTGNLSKHLKKQHHISLEQTFVVKKEINQSILRIRKAETNLDGDFDSAMNSLNFFDDNLNGPLDTDDSNVEEFLVHDINEILIQEVQKRPILYNPSLCQERGQKHQIRRQLWNEIYEALNHLIPYEKLPKTWKNIRDRYYKIKRGLENNATNDVEVRPRYRYYHLLRFLDNPPEHIDKRDIECKSPQSTKSHTDNYVDVDAFMMNTDHQDYITTDVVDLSNDRDFDDDDLQLSTKRVKLSPGHPLDSDSHYDDDNQHDQDSFTTLTTSTDLLSSIESVRMSSIPTSYMLTHDDQDHMMDAQRQPMLSDHPIDRKNDEYGKFGDFVAEVMRNMNKAQARSFQMKVMSLIIDCEQNN